MRSACVKPCPRSTQNHWPVLWRLTHAAQQADRLAQPPSHPQRHAMQATVHKDPPTAWQYKLVGQVLDQPAQRTLIMLTTKSSSHTTPHLNAMQLMWRALPSLICTAKCAAQQVLQKAWPQLLRPHSDPGLSHMHTSQDMLAAGSRGPVAAGRKKAKGYRMCSKVRAQQSPARLEQVHRLKRKTPA
jgi:hypothetical protein